MRLVLSSGAYRQPVSLTANGPLLLTVVMRSVPTVVALVVCPVVLQIACVQCCYMEGDRLRLSDFSWIFPDFIGGLMAMRNSLS